MSITALILRAIGAQAREHQATVGWRRVFESAADARQYEAGHTRWPGPLPLDVALSSPHAQGWFDAEHDQQLRDDERIEKWERERELESGTEFDR